MTSKSAQEIAKKAEKELKQLNNKVQNIRAEVDKSTDVKTRFLQAEITDLKDHGKKCRAALHERLNDVEEKSKELEGLLNSLSETIKPTEHEEFPTKKTVVARFVKQPDGVDLQDIAEILIHEGMGLDHVKVQKVQSMSKDEDNIGTIKILLESSADLSEVLKAKTKLNEYDEDPDMQNVRVRQSKSHEQFVFEQNTDTILKALNEYGSFYRDARGFLHKKRGGMNETNLYESSTNNNRQRPYRGGRGNRGVQRRRGGGSSRQDCGRNGQNRNNARSDNWAGSSESLSVWNQQQESGQQENSGRPRRELSDRSRRLFSQ